MIVVHRKTKTVMALGAALCLQACTAAELQAFAVGLSAATEELAYQNALQYAEGPAYCDPGYRLELGYDEYNNPVRFCVPDRPY